MRAEMDNGPFGLLCHGTISGTGKTRVATQAAGILAGCWFMCDEAGNEKFDDNPAGIWINFHRFRCEYGEIMRDAEARSRYQRELADCNVLMLDDIDKLKPSEGLVELIFGVLDERFSNGNDTIMTTNSCGAALAERWGEHGPYLVRRIRDFCVCVDFDL
jgi:DNA replication protein DnaC